MRPLAPRPALVALLPLLLLLLLLLPERVGGIPKVQKELNVHGPKDDDLRPDAISPEAVAKLYMALLGRPVDDHGAAHYQSGAGYSVTQVADELLNSMEFRAKYSDNEMDSFGIPVEFAQAARFQDVLSVDIMATELDVRYLYSRLFDRQPDEVALAAYAPVIEAKSLAVIDMISDLMRSDEFGVSFLYQRILGAYTRGSARQVPWFPSFLPACLPPPALWPDRSRSRLHGTRARAAGRKADEEGKRHVAELKALPIEAATPPADADGDAAAMVPPPPPPPPQGLSLAQVADELLRSEEFVSRAAADAQAAGIDASSGKPLMWAQAAEFCDELTHFAATPADIRYLYNRLLGAAMFLLHQFVYYKSDIYQDRLGTNIGKTSETCRFCRARAEAGGAGSLPGQACERHVADHRHSAFRRLQGRGRRPDR